MNPLESPGGRRSYDGFCISTVCSVGSVLRNPSEIISSSPFYHPHTHYRGRIRFYFRASFLERTYLLALEWTPLWYTLLRLVALSLYAVVCLALLMTIRDSNHLLPDGAYVCHWKKRKNVSRYIYKRLFAIIFFASYYFVLEFLLWFEYCDIRNPKFNSHRSRGHGY